MPLTTGNSNANAPRPPGLGRERPVRVGIDARPLNRSYVRGMGTYVSELVAHLDGYGAAFVAFGDRPDLPFHRPAAAAFSIDLFDSKGYRFRSWEQWALPRRARSAGIDVLHCTMSSLPWWQPVPTVVTLHDTLSWSADEPVSDPRWYLDGVLPRAFAKAAAIITGSVHASRDIAARWPSLSRKVHVIPHGIDRRYSDDVPPVLAPELEALGVRRPYLLYVGGTIPRKRLDWALEVFRGTTGSGLSIVICGVPHAQLDAVRDSIRNRGIGPAMVAPYLSEQVMPSLVRNSVAVLYPSLYEGFGFPVLEANALGVPVLHSAVSSLSELAGPASIVLPAQDLGAWTAACVRLAAERLGSAVNEPARQWARRFSWDESARRHLALYETAAGYRSLTP